MITFYKAQETAIHQALFQEGIVERDESNYQVVSKYRDLQTQDGAVSWNGFAWGTVDAFQGKEFDIVFLSMTRSNDLPCDPTDIKTQRRKFGHLMLQNRLCVAMSRQKRALVVVGDARMLRQPSAKDVIPRPW